SRLLQYCLVRRGFIAGSMLTGLVLALGLGILVVRFEMFPVDQAWRMWIYGKTRQDSNLEATERQAMRVESIVQSLPAGVIKSFTTTTGIKWDGTQVLPNLFLMELILSPSTERSMSAEEIKVFAFSRIREQKIPFDMDYYIDGGGPPAGKPIEIQVIGNENTQRLALLDQIQKDLESLGATNVDSNYTAGKPEIRLEPIHERIAQARLSVAQVATAIRTAFDGTVAAYLDTDEERIPFRVMLAEQSKDFENPLRGIKVMNSTGALIPVERVVRMHRVSSPQTIFHYNGHRSNQVTANIDRQKTTTSAFYAKLQGRYDPLMRENRGFRIELGGEGKESANTFSEMIIAIIVAVIGIYFILTVQFDSFLQPSMVLLAIPFGLAGILLAFALHGLGLSMLALVGILGFAGVVVNDSLVMVDQINQIRSNRLNSAESFHEEIIEGARNRLRPIVLTTLTTVAGLIPTAYGWFGGFDSFLSPLVMAMAWGLIVGTPATLFVIPVLYSLLHDLERRWRREGQ
ncbi:MAG: efflux RND transporter permease subunit, partial [Leptospiraceae bacterium]|nr:efflux RND transporter permease subunit [Leptospiraceae bacterium]